MEAQSKVQNMIDNHQDLESQPSGNLNPILQQALQQYMYNDGDAKDLQALYTLVQNCEPSPQIQKQPDQTELADMIENIKSETNDIIESIKSSKGKYHQTSNNLPSSSNEQIVGERK